MKATFEQLDGQILETRVKQDEEAFQKIGEIIQKSLQSNKYGLPFLPAYFNPGSEDDIRSKIKRVEEMEDARINEFCLDRCAKEGPFCMKSCTDFANMMHQKGQAIYFRLQREYPSTKFTQEEEE